MTSSWSEWLTAQAAAREAAGLTRTLRPRASQDTVIDLAGNDYLGFARHPAVRGAAAAAAEEWGGGAGASRLVTGTLALHAELELALARLMRQPAALVFSTGYHANLGVVTALADRDTRVISDAHVHASLIDATRLSRAVIEVVPHNDVEAVTSRLAALTSQPSAPRTLVLAESIYSVLGDAAPLRELAAACEEYGALLVVDEAHGLGVHGPGLVARLGLAGQEHVVVAATLSKALGSQGGAVLGSPALIEHLVNRARPFIFDTGLAPAAAAAALAATQLIEAHPELPALIRRRVDELAGLLGVPAPDGAVLSVPMPSPQAAVEAAAACAEQGVRVGCFRPPSVPDGMSRLRVTCSAGVGDDDWARATQVLLEITKGAAR
ncbi:8-amino-7-oxononanoate synthase [Nocardioides nematodiphilus]|uniref:8-amino-7-oxononanoate synthase n=1 Tax=Nocardioides nematodiphilus TaxID=2849669 RepID=UPI001CD94A6A|nr:8-amino-7-oxononanoate synthase [Nocardioides nematodiphilus]MCA1983654.1 8-amino-7-oxononanoate synthase [Nocardioides nematodiphilus]